MVRGLYNIGIYSMHCTVHTVYSQIQEFRSRNLGMVHYVYQIEFKCIPFTN